MRRTALIVLVGVFVATLGMDAGAARRDTDRAGKTYEARYDRPAPGACADAADTSTCGYAYSCKDEPTYGCALIQLKRPASWVHIEIADDSGLPVRAQVYPYGSQQPAAIFCAAPGDKVKVDVGGAWELLVHVVGGTCPDSTPSTPTSGVVRVTTRK